MIDQRFELSCRHRAALRLGDAQLDAGGLREMGIQYELGLVMQFVDDDVIAAAKVHRVGRHVLALARGEEEADFVRACVDQLCVLRTHRIGFPQHVAERDRRVAFRLRELAARVHDRNRGRRDVRRVQKE